MVEGWTVLISKICWVELRASTGCIAKIRKCVNCHAPFIKSILELQKDDSTLKMSEGAALQETSIGSSRLTIGNNKTLFRQLVSVCIAVNKVINI